VISLETTKEKTEEECHNIRFGDRGGGKFTYRWNQTIRKRWRALTEQKKGARNYYWEGKNFDL